MKRSSLIVLFVLVAWLFMAPPVVADPPAASADAAAAGTNLGPDDIRFYTFEYPSERLPDGPFSKLWKDHPRMRKGPHPMLQWYYWANERKRFIPSFLFIAFFSLVLWAVAPGWLARAQEPVKEKFWSTFFIGALVEMIFVTGARVSIATMIGWPLGIGLLGLLELVLIAGLSVLVSALGSAIAFFVRLEKWPLVGRAAGGRRFAELMIGSLIFAALLQIPPIGTLPRLGTRLVALFAVLGLGALYRTRPGRA